MKHQWNSKGYDTEELYFEKMNRELIEALKKQRPNTGQSAEGDTALAEVIPFETKKTPQKKAA